MDKKTCPHSPTLARDGYLARAAAAVRDGTLQASGGQACISIAKLRLRCFSGTYNTRRRGPEGAGCTFRNTGVSLMGLIRPYSTGIARIHWRFCLAHGLLKQEGDTSRVDSTSSAFADLRCLRPVYVAGGVAGD